MYLCNWGQGFSSRRKKTYVRMMEYKWRLCTWGNTCIMCTCRRCFIRKVDVYYRNTSAWWKSFKPAFLPPLRQLSVLMPFVGRVARSQRCSWKTKCVFKLFSPSFSHESHGPAHGEDGGHRSRRRPRGDALLLQGQDGQPRSRAALHKGGQLQILPIGDVTVAQFLKSLTY